ncbi:MAG: UvrB/UvrC motif-containing protein [Firmicutes bacterium]|nr:UvrB/UvrC motif-containing protein [Bacillota bacterium]
MICDNCGKRVATVHITKIENGKKTDFHLCEQCAISENTISINTSFSISDLLTGILNNTEYFPLKFDFQEELKCPVCGLSYNRFRETGRFGCSNCYKTFGDRLNPLFRRLHGNINHLGKIPVRTGGKMKKVREIEKLKAALNFAVKNEEYEKAAEIRDRIKELDRISKGEENK